MEIHGKNTCEPLESFFLYCIGVLEPLKDCHGKYFSERS